MGGEQQKFELSVPQIGGSALAAVTAAVAASYLGVAGTVIGAAVMSVASTVGTAVYTHYLKRTGDKVIRRTVVARRWQVREHGAGEAEDQGALAAAAHATVGAAAAPDPTSTRAAVPAAAPPMTKPRVTNPPATESPVINPPVTSPPVTEPPVTGREHVGEEDATVVMPPVTAPLPAQAGDRTAPLAAVTAPLAAVTAPLVAVTALAPAVPPLADPGGSRGRMPAWGKVAVTAGLVFGVSMGSILAYQGITRTTVHEQLTGQVPASAPKHQTVRREQPSHDPAPRVSTPYSSEPESAGPSRPATPSPTLSPTPTPSRSRGTSTPTATPTPAPTATRTHTGSARPTEPATSAPPEETGEPDVVEEEPQPDSDVLPQ
ncbi:MULTISPECIES: hypothetical protein [unclassified Nonomuraea]|uniref:hypothetical protein n=1 Tax=unclassified Nonomuraea TaxID=2593643 RepID=UPI0033F2E4A2